MAEGFLVYAVTAGCCGVITTVHVKVCSLDSLTF